MGKEAEGKEERGAAFIQEDERCDNSFPLPTFGREKRKFKNQDLDRCRASL